MTRRRPGRGRHPLGVRLGVTPSAFYTGAQVSDEFMARWRSGAHIGAFAPYMEVRIRHGIMAPGWKTWMGTPFGQINNRAISDQWFSDWHVFEDWRALPGVAQIDLDQSFDKNGSTLATLMVDNVRYTPLGDAHVQERGVYWPWKGQASTRNSPPSTTQQQNEWYEYLPNKQIDIFQGYGPSEKVRTFTGIIDTWAPTIRPDRIQIVARDFGGILTDSPMFGNFLPPDIREPLLFVPRDHPMVKEALSDPSLGPFVIVDDAVDVVKCILRWAGFKEWEVEDSGVNLGQPLSVDKTQTAMQVINAVRDQLGYVFFMGEPTNNDLSIGVPIFRRASVLIAERETPTVNVQSKDLITDLKPTHDNKDERDTIRVFGQYTDVQFPTTSETNELRDYWWPWFVGPKSVYALKDPINVDDNGNRYVVRQPNAWYGPPWVWRAASETKPLTDYNLGDGGVIGFRTDEECRVAAILIAIQIGLAMDTATMQVPGQPAIGLDSFVGVDEHGTGVTSRLYVTNRKSTMRIDGQQGSSDTELIWSSELGGALVDNPDMYQMVTDYREAADIAANRHGAGNPAHVDSLPWDGA